MNNDGNTARPSPPVFLNKHFLAASFRGDVAEVKRLLSAGADVQASNNLALRWAVHHEFALVVETLIQSGADLTALFLPFSAIAYTAQTINRNRIQAIKTYAMSANRRFEAVMMLKPTSRLDVLRHLHPELKPKQIRDELSMMHALGLDAAQMAEMWRARHGAAQNKPDRGVSP